MSLINPLILNIESATDVCSVCVSSGTEILSYCTSDEKMAHSKILTLLIEEAINLAEVTLSDLDAVAVSRGPGSYTSLRVGSSVAKGICYALNKPLLAVDTLQTIAAGAAAQEGDTSALYAPMIDARRMEVYTAHFSSSSERLTETSADIITENSYAEIFKSGKKIIFCGNGAEKCRSVLNSPLAFFLPSTCSARFLPRFSVQRFLDGKFEDTAYFEPEYFKAPNITKSKKRLL